MRPKGMEDLVAFSAREVKRAAAEEREQQQRKEKETSIPLQMGSESQSRRQSHPRELSES